jgi:hypothetical protein
MLLRLLRPDAQAHWMSPPSGEDSLQARQTYLRRRRSRNAGSWYRTAAWVVVGAAVFWLGIAGFSVFLLGS